MPGWLLWISLLSSNADDTRWVEWTAWFDSDRSAAVRRGEVVTGSGEGQRAASVLVRDPSSPRPPIRSTSTMLIQSSAAKLDRLVESMRRERSGRFVGDRANITRELWMTGLWGHIFQPLADISQFPDQVSFPPAIDSQPCEPPPFAWLLNSAHENQILVDLQHGEEAMFCPLQSHPDGSNTSKRMSLEDPCYPGTTLQPAANLTTTLHEVVRVARSAPDGSIRFNSLVGLIVNATRLSEAMQRTHRYHAPNLNFVVLDSTSRISFLLQAPKTTALLERAGVPSRTGRSVFVFQYGYFNIVGFSTPHCLNAMFGGCIAAADSPDTDPVSCEAYLPELFRKSGYLTSIVTQHWPAQRNYAGFDHAVALDINWIARQHSCRPGSAVTCDTVSHDGILSEFWPSVPQTFVQTHAYRHMRADTCIQAHEYRHERKDACVHRAKALPWPIPAGQ